MVWDTGQNIGYIRVSSQGQNSERQLNGISLDKTFEDKISGSTVERAELQACIDYVRQGDTLHIHSMDRLARNLIDLKNIVSKLADKGVSVHFHKENLVFKNDNSPMDNLLLNIIGSVAEFERSLIKERQAEGIALAKQKGVHLGRPSALSKDQIKELKQMKNDKIKVPAIASKFGISRASVYNYLKG